MPRINAELIYNLRCNFLHEGNVKIKDELNIKHFHLLIQTKHRVSRTIETYEESPDMYGLIKRSLCVSVVNLCEDLCYVANQFYEANKEKFEDEELNICYMDPHLAKIMHIKWY